MMSAFSERILSLGIVGFNSEAPCLILSQSALVGIHVIGFPMKVTSVHLPDFKKRRVLRATPFSSCPAIPQQITSCPFFMKRFP